MARIFQHALSPIAGWIGRSKKSWFAALGLLIFLSASVSANQITLVYALDRDWQELRADLEVITINSKGVPIHTTKIGNHTIAAVKMEAGNVPTALQVKAALDFKPSDLVIALGPAGGLVDQVEIGKVYIVSRIIAYQRGTWASAGWTISEQSMFSLPKHLAGGEVAQWADLPSMALASGDAFIASHEVRRRLAVETQASLVDMNSYGLAMACASRHTPLVNIKICSDYANDSASEDFANFVSRYDGELGKLVRQWLEALPLSQNNPMSHDAIRTLLEE